MCGNKACEGPGSEARVCVWTSPLSFSLFSLAYLVRFMGCGIVKGCERSSEEELELAYDKNKTTVICIFPLLLFQDHQIIHTDNKGLIDWQIIISIKNKQCKKRNDAMCCVPPVTHLCSVFAIRWRRYYCHHHADEDNGNRHVSGSFWRWYSE